MFCFNKSEGYGEKTVPKLTWGLVIPHTIVSPGASSFDKTTNEYRYGLEMAEALSPIPYATRNKKGVKGAILELKEQGVNCSLEPHGNAYNGQSRGSEILVLKGDKESERAARHILEDFNELNPQRVLRHDNGIKWIEKGDRGYTNLKTAKNLGMRVALLSELHFIDSSRDFMTVQDQANFWRRHILIGHGTKK